MLQSLKECYKFCVTSNPIVQDIWVYSHWRCNREDVFKVVTLMFQLLNYMQINKIITVNHSVSLTCCCKILALFENKSKTHRSEVWHRTKIHGRSGERERVMKVSIPLMGHKYDGFRQLLVITIPKIGTWPNFKGVWSFLSYCLWSQ